MATKLNGKIAEFDKDGLIASAIPQAEVFTVTLAAGEGTLKRGTVLALGSDGAYSVLGASTESQGNEGESKQEGNADTEDAAASATATANCILADDVELDAAAETNAVAYRTGHFTTQKLIVADGYTLTAADKEALRDVGILLSDVMEY